ncbi:catenin delta-1-like, partial [Narcine bancroftii]|uniref:catenin delta-1-like n=1 Tax=Narcine bancroftii TaxID=1343680 RepID=UPI0038311452
KKVNEGASVDVEIPRRSTPAKGYELLYQPEVVRLYLSLIRECSNPAVLEAAAGAIQNLCAGRWMYGRYIRAAVRQEKGLSNIAERLMHDNDRVVKAVSGALRNLALDERNKELIGKHAMLNLIHALPSMAQGKGSKSLAEDTVVSVLQTLNELLVDNVEAARRLREQQGVERLVGIIRSGTHSDREMKASSAVLQTLWHHRELRKPLQNDGWKKADFQHLSSTQNPTESAFDDSTLPLIDKSQRAGDKREMIPMNDMGPVLESPLLIFSPHPATATVQTATTLSTTGTQPTLTMTLANLWAGKLRISSGSQLTLTSGALPISTRVKQGSRSLVYLHAGGTRRLGRRQRVRSRNWRLINRLAGRRLPGNRGWPLIHQDLVMGRVGGFYIEIYRYMTGWNERRAGVGGVKGSGNLLSSPILTGSPQGKGGTEWSCSLSACPFSHPLPFLFPPSPFLPPSLPYLLSSLPPPFSHTGTRRQ